MKIIFVLGELGMGGAERQLILLARGLVARGQDVTLALFRTEGPLQAEAEALGLRIEVIGGGKPLATMARLRRLIRAERPDVVHGYLTAGNIASLVTLSLPHRPLLAWGVRASNMQMRNYGIKWRIAAGLERFFARLVDLLIVNSQAGKQVLVKQGVPDESITVIENGIDLDRLVPAMGDRERVRSGWGIEPGRLVIGHVGRVDPMKDHAGLFAALALLQRLRQDWDAVIVAVGSESDRERLRREAAACGLADHIRIQGPAKAMAGIYAGFDLFCSSSAYGEGFSNVIAEALGASLPVVATDVGDARLLVGDAGMIAPPGNPEALAAALDCSLQERDRFAARARDQIARFSVERLAERTSLALVVASELRQPIR